MLDDAIANGQGARIRRRASGPDIIAASSALFVEGGLANFGSRAAAARAGMSLSTLQYYYPTTTALLEATVRSLMDVYLEEVGKILADRSQSREARLRAWITYNVSEMRKRFTCLLFFEVWSVAQRHEGVRQIVTDTYTVFREQICVFLEEFPSKLSDDERLNRATLMIAQTEGLLLFMFKGAPAVADMHELTEACYAAVLALCMS
jgi:AcrR family transcriptional regulator